MRAFTDVIGDHRNGKLNTELSERLGKVVASVEDTGKKGSITLTLTINPKKGEEGAFTVTPAIKVVIPENDLPDALFFSDEHGSLVRESPIQRGMFAVDDIESDAPRRSRRSGED